MKKMMPILQVVALCDKGNLAQLRHCVEELGNIDLLMDDKTSTSGLIIAARNGQFETVRYLIEEAPKFGQKSDVAKTDFAVFNIACVNGYTDIVAYLIEEAPKFGQPRIDLSGAAFSTLSQAGFLGQLQVVKYLIEEAPAFGVSVDLSAVLTPLVKHLVFGCEYNANSETFEVLKYYAEVVPRSFGYAPDFRDCETWTLFSSTFGMLLEETQHYLRERKMLQELLDLDGYVELMRSTPPESKRRI